MVYLLKSLGFSVAGALLIAVIASEIGGAEDGKLLFFMSFLGGLAFTVILCPLAYLAAKATVRLKSSRAIETALVLLTGGALCAAVTAVLIWAGSSGDASMNLGETLSLTSLFLAGWAVYALGMELAGRG